MDGTPVLSLQDIDAVIFDMDGVVTDTAATHARAWKRLFDAYLSERSARTGEPFRPFDADRDYRRFVDGRPRYDGVRSFLASRDIALGEGDPSDPGDKETVCGLGNRKDAYFREFLSEGGAQPFVTTLELVRELQSRGVRTAIISSSRNMTEVLASAGVEGLFEVRVDGLVADELGLPGKPDPATFLEAGRRLGVEPERAAVVEDALAGVEAGRRGGFRLVVGVDRTGHPQALAEAGADVVVRDLGDLRIATAEMDDLRLLPSALDRLGEILSRLRAGRPAVFLDYDGTLTPVVRHPSEAVIDEEARRVIRELASVCPVAMISGRDLDDVRTMVGVDGISYAGSHGFDILASDGTRHRQEGVDVEALAAAAAELEDAVGEVPGAWVERKRFALAVHVREVEERLVPRIEAAVRAVAGRHPTLRQTGGKRIFELRPAIEWDKGKALLSLLGVLGLDDVVPVYIGDDETDEDAFAAIRDRGIGIVVRGEADDRRTAAGYALAGPDEVRRLLAALATELRREP